VLAVVSHGRPAIGVSWRAGLGRAAELVGAVAGRVLGWSRSVPGVGGAALVSYGAWAVFRPAGFMVAGAFCLMLDQRL